MKKFIILITMIVAASMCTEINAQSWLKKLGKKVENAAKNAVERNAERKTEKIVDDVFDGNINLPEGQSDDGSQSDDSSTSQSGQSGQQKGQSLEMTYAKSDFVAGDEIIFDDPMDNEQLGEWPTQWELYDGIGETASVGGKKALHIHKR